MHVGLDLFVSAFNELAIRINGIDWLFNEKTIRLFDSNLMVDLRVVLCIDK